MTLKKACLGAGIPAGLAEEIYKAGGLLVLNGHDGAGAVLATLEGRHKKEAQTEFVDGRQIFRNACAGICGPSGIDMILTGDEGNSCFFENADSPLLLAGLCAYASSGSATGFELKCANDAVMVIRGSRITLEGTVPAGACDVTMKSFPVDKSSQPIAAKSAKSFPVTFETWKVLCDLAAKTYVPASEQSRLKGAGAGLDDND